jgi:hypothetical protein
MAAFTSQNVLLDMQGQADVNGTVPFGMAQAAAETIGIKDAFEATYGDATGWGTGVDVGEFIAWVQG